MPQRSHRVQASGSARRNPTRCQADQKERHCYPEGPISLDDQLHRQQEHRHLPEHGEGHGDDVIAMGMSGIAGNIAPRSVIGGIPAIPRQTMIENHFYFGRIKKFMKKIELFSTRIDTLEQNMKKD